MGSFVKTHIQASDVLLVKNHRRIDDGRLVTVLDVKRMDDCAVMVCLIFNRSSGSAQIVQWIVASCRLDKWRKAGWVLLD